MKMRPWAEFASTLPNDRIDSEDEMDILQYPGKLLSETLAGILKGLGYEIIELICLHERGWELLIRGGPKGRSRFGIRVTQIDKYLIGLFSASSYIFVESNDYTSSFGSTTGVIPSGTRYMDNDVMLMYPHAGKYATISSALGGLAETVTADVGDVETP